MRKMGDDSEPERLPKRKRASGKPPRIALVEEDDEDYAIYLKKIEAMIVYAQSPERFPELVEYDNQSRGELPEAVEDGGGSPYMVPAAAGDNAGDDDLQYRKFLENLRKDGKSYALVVEGDAGERKLLKYEPQEGDAVPSEELARRIDVHAEGLKSRSRRISVKKEFVASDGNLRSVEKGGSSERMKPGRPRSVDRGESSEKKKPGRPRSAERGESSNKKKPRRPGSASVRRGNDKGSPLRKYSRTDEDVKGPRVSTKRLTRGSRGVSVGEEITASDGKTRSAMRVESSEKLSNPKNASGRNGKDGARHLKRDSRYKEAVRISEHPARRRREQDVDVEGGSPASKKRKECRRGSPRAREVHSSKNYRADFKEWDESYSVFMHYLREDGGFALFNQGNWKVRYEEDVVEESCSSSDLQILDMEDVLRNEVNNPFVTATLGNTIDLVDGNCGENEHSEFREKLLEKLRVPYDEAEYKELLQKVKLKRRKEIVKQLRGGREKSYLSKQSCESYLEQYPDLARKVSSSKGNRRKTLSILRGFFFYLSNLPMEGVFQPWRDRYCLRMLPPPPPAMKLVKGVKSEPSYMFPAPPPPLVKKVRCVKVEAS